MIFFGNVKLPKGKISILKSCGKNMEQLIDKRICLCYTYIYSNYFEEVTNEYKSIS